MIAESAIKAKVTNFSKLANHVGGRKLELFLQINILIYMWGSCISYQILSILTFFNYLNFLLNSFFSVEELFGYLWT